MNKYKIKKHILWRMIEGEVVIVDPERDDYSYLNDLGSEIWSMIAKGCSEDIIVERLGTQYDEKEIVIKNDVKKLLKNLVSEGLIEKV